MICNSGRCNTIHSFKRRVVTQLADLLMICFIFLLGIVLSSPVLYPPAPGVDAPMHLSKTSRLSDFFPFFPRWFPWWYCGTPLMSAYPPLLYYINVLTIALLHCEPWLALGIVDTIVFSITGILIFLVLKEIGFYPISCLSSGILYLSSFQTLSGRFLWGHYTHTFGILFLVCGIYIALKFHSSRYYEAYLATIFSLMVLSHLAIAISFVGLILTYYCGFLLARVFDVEIERKYVLPFFRTLLGGLSGLLLVGFWLIPYIAISGARTAAFMGSTAKYVPPLQSLFLKDSQNIWLQSYYLGLPLIFFGLIGVIISLYKKQFWGFIFTFWTFFFLFMTIQPILFQGWSIGYPPRYPFFVAFTMALLSGTTINYLSSRGKYLRFLRMFCWGTFLFLLIVNAVYVRPIVFKGYVPENRIANELNTYLDPYERLASISTFSYTFNVVSNRFQIDGGYIEGNINFDFYRRYWNIIFFSNDTDRTVRILRKLNARLVLFYGSIPPEIQNKFTSPLFNVVFQEPPITIFELNRTLIPLDFVEVKLGKGKVVNLSYDNPDLLEFELINCTGQTKLLVKMNYHPGWTAYAYGAIIQMFPDNDGFIQLVILSEGNIKIRLQYSYTLIDYLGMIVSLLGSALILRTTVHYNKIIKLLTHIRHGG